MLQRHLRKIGVELFGQNHRHRGVDALPHLDLRHDQRGLAGIIDADEGIGRKLAVGHIRRLHRLIGRAYGHMKSEQNPPARPLVRRSRRESPGEIPCTIAMIASYDWRPEAACLIAARMRT